MARLTLDMPDTYLFATELNVRISDINYGGHLGHDALISLLHEARVRWLRSLGYTEADIEGSPLVISDLAVIYKAQAFHGDVLTIEIAAGDLNKYGCDLFYRVTHAETSALVLEAKTGIVFFDYRKKQICRIPGKFAEKFS